MKIRPVGIVMLHAYGQTDRHYEANKALFATLGMRLLKWVAFTLVYLHLDGFYFTIIAVKVHGDREQFTII
jgi:hypothetical protein